MEMFARFDNIFLKPFIECSEHCDVLDELRKSFPGVKFHQRFIGWMFEQAFSEVMENYSSQNGNLIKKVKGPPF
jgi:hypothetical protein